MRNLIWRPDAERQYLAVLDYIAQRNFAAATKLQADIDRQIAYLPKTSHIGRPGRVAGTRELVVHPNYIVVYRVTPNNIYVTRFLHAHQNYP